VVPSHREKPSEYRLKASGEIITNPDLLCTWSIYRKGVER